MTIGIIQKVFGELEQSLFMKGYSYEKDPQVFRLIGLTMQELIAQIENEQDLEIPNENNVFVKAITLKELIGNSGEKK